jgi:hypothetical protein
MIGDMATDTEAVFLAKIPIGQNITLTGYNLHTHSTFEIITTNCTTDNDDLQKNGEMHYMRFLVLSLLEQSRNLLAYNISDTDVNEYINKINNSIKLVTEYRNNYEHSLWNVLLDELNCCKKLLENRNLNNTEHSCIISQRAGYLGRMKGLPASILYNPTNALPLPNSHAFSNYTQRQISSQLSANVIPLHRQESVYDTFTNSQVLSGLNTPNLQLSPINNYVHTSILSPDNISLPPLTRQIACNNTI